MRLPFSWHTLLRGILLLIALLHGYRLWQDPPAPAEAVDFRNVYVGALLLREGADPYDDAALKARWIDIAAGDAALQAATLPGLPNNPLLYPPWALPLFTPFILLPFKAAAWCWYALSLVLLLLSVAAVAAAMPEGKGHWLTLLLLVFAFKGTLHAWQVGQPVFLCIAALLWAWRFDAQGRALPAGLLLGIAAFKITLALPLGLLWIMRRRWKGLAVAAATGALLCLAALCWTGELVAPFRGWLALAQTFRSGLLNPPAGESPFYTLTQLSEWGAPVYAFRLPGRQLLPLLYAALLAGALAWTFSRLRQGRWHELQAWLFVQCAFFLCNYHQFYDLLVLLPLYVMASRQAKPTRSDGLLLCAALAPLLLPLNGLLQRMYLPPSLHGLYFSTPLAILLLWIWLIKYRSGEQL